MFRLHTDCKWGKVMGLEAMLSASTDMNSPRRMWARVEEKGMKSASNSEMVLMVIPLMVSEVTPAELA